MLRARPAARALFGACLAGALSFASPAAAQTEGLQNGDGFDLHLFRPAVDSKGLITLNGSDILGAGDVSFGLVVDAGFGLGRIGVNHRSLVDAMFTGTFHANIGIANLLVLGAQVPVQFASGPDNNDTNGVMTTNLGIARSEYAPGTGGLNFQGMGDLVLHAKLRWLRGEYYPVGLAVLLQVGIPVVSGSQQFAGEPGPWVWPSLALDRRIGRRGRIDFNLGLRFPFGTSSTITTANDIGGTNVSYGPSITFGAGASYRVGTVLDLMAEVYGAQYVNGFSNAGLTTPFEAIAGLKIFVDRNSYLLVGGGTGVMSPGVAAAGARAFLGFIFEPSIGDTDGDGYRDDVDRCVLEPEDFDNFEDEDGCPEPDNDRDGILDVNDQCPLVPEDRNGNHDDDGCPDSEVQDRDGDQIADNVDHCPDDPEDRDGFEDDNGCPDPDNDQDRILDAVDQCPNNPETYNGYLDTDGCPDTGVIVVTGPEIHLPPINFETDSAQIVDNADNRRTMEQLVALLNTRTDFELVEIEGHTDERAPDDHNLALSLDRANAVVAALVQRGVTASRLVAAGYGEYCPINPQSNAAAWAENRRVQALIIRENGLRTSARAGCPRGRQYIPANVGAPNRN